SGWMLAVAAAVILGGLAATVQYDRRSTRWLDAVACALLAVRAAGSLSNSFIIYGDRAALWMLNALLILRSRAGSTREQRACLLGVAVFMRVAWAMGA